MCVINYRSSHGWLNEKETGNIPNKKKIPAWYVFDTEQTNPLLLIVIVYKAWSKNNILTKWSEQKKERMIQWYRQFYYVDL
jgi:hypothetical protein